MYKVISDFYDLEDDRRAGNRPPIYQYYRVGDIYPRNGILPSKERIEELSGIKNRLHKRLIIKEEEEEKEKEKEKEERKEELKPKRRTRKKKGETEDGAT